jgi:hypothetical protein
MVPIRFDFQVYKHSVIIEVSLKLHSPSCIKGRNKDENEADRLRPGVHDLACNGGSAGAGA